MAADPALLQRVIEEEGIQATPSGGVGDLLEALKEWLWEFLGHHDGLSLPDWLRWVFAMLIVLTAMGVVAAFLWPSLQRGWRALTGRHGPVESEEMAVTVALPVDPDPEADLEAALARRDARAALRALWRTLTSRLAAAGRGRLGPHLTHREFIASVRATDPSWPGLAPLAALGRAVERRVYGQHAPGMDDVRKLVQDAKAIGADA